MTLRERLDKCALDGALSTADIAVWMDLPHATVRSYRNGVEPYPARRQQIDERLQWLEQAVRKSRLLPVPLEVRSHQRKAHILRVRRDFDR